MFNLIVAVISIALIAAMAAASIFYGGEAFSESTAQAQASTLVNNGQQISGAQQLHQIDNSGNRETVIANLVTENYLQALPTAPSYAPDPNAIGLVRPAWELSDDGRIGMVDIDDALAPTICEAVVEDGGIQGILPDNGGVYEGVTVASMTDGAQFGCFDLGQDTIYGRYVFAYKL